MQILREIREVKSDRIWIDIPERFLKEKVEVVISTIEQNDQNLDLQKKIRAIDGLNGLIADIDREKMDEFDRVVNERNSFRSEMIEL